MNGLLARAVLAFLVLPGTVAFFIPWLLIEPGQAGQFVGMVPLWLECRAGWGFVGRSIQEQMRKIRDLEDGLATYIHVLSDSAERCRRAEDRPTYQHHLAEAARMFASLRGQTPLESVKAIVVSERRAYGRSFLSDEAGERAEAAFNHFASLVECLRPNPRPGWLRGYGSPW